MRTIITLGMLTVLKGYNVNARNIIVTGSRKTRVNPIYIFV
jgi:hypothetical protein